ncbi:LysM peptidoglycan-binding domain-containing protein, partial [Lysobacter sp. A3-1-A15]
GVAGPATRATAPVAGAATQGAAATRVSSHTGPRRHVVARGENPWLIARRYGIRVADLLSLNGLRPGSVLQPGTALHVDPPAASP